MSADKDREARRQVLHNRLRELNGAIVLGEARVGRIRRTLTISPIQVFEELQEARQELIRLRWQRTEVLNELNSLYKDDIKID